ncbi:sulfatase, partial [bacterium]|nr:sulfatase [bacterium]MBU1025260.1 sulfatase [bacterium]
STTPNIDSLAGQSLLFERCYAQSTEAFRSMATMITSKYPACYPTSKGRNAGLGFRDLVHTPEPTLVDFIREAGHTTCGIVSDSSLRGAFGFANGFDYYDDKLISEPDDTFRVRTTEESYEAAESWLSRNFRRPFFMLVQFPDPMGPYDADQRFVEQLSNSSFYSTPGTINVSRDDNHPINQLPAYHNVKDETVTVGELIRQYDAEIAETDNFIGKILNTLNRLDIADKTMIVISSLHGEALGEHGHYFDHGENVYHCLSHIPLIIYNPKGRSARIKDVVEGIDIMPTILSYLGVNPESDLSGSNLMRFFTTSKPELNYPAFCYWDNPKMYSVIKGDYELLFMENQEYRLYHIINDPEEIHNLYSEDDPFAQELKSLLDTWLEENHQRALNNDFKRSYGPSGSKKPLSVPPKDSTIR